MLILVRSYLNLATFSRANSRVYHRSKVLVVSLSLVSPLIGSASGTITALSTQDLESDPNDSSTIPRAID